MLAVVLAVSVRYRRGGADRGQTQAQKAVGQDAGFEKGIEVSFDEDARSRH
jgi:hypothetical protein